MNFIRHNLIGAIIISSLVVFSIFISHFLSSKNILISSAFVCIFLGLISGNIFSLKKIDPFINFCLKRLLRVGIAFLGLSLSLNELFDYGFTALLLIIINIIIAFLLIKLLCNLFKIPDVLGYLITMGTCICGVTAVIATSTIIKPDKDQTSYAVGVVTLFGITAVFFYPYIANYYFHLSPDLAGIFLGTAIHDTAQVSAASVIYSELYNSEEALNSAMTTKLLRNSFLIFLIPLIAYLYNKDKKVDVKSSIKDFFPFFVLGFIILCILRTLGDYLMVDNDFLDYWKYSLIFFKEISIYCILFSMVALGLQTNIKSMLTLGYKPFLVGFSSSVLVGLISILYLSALNI